MIAADLATRLGGDLGFETLDDIAVEIERLAPSHAGLTPQLLSRPGYRDGVVVPLADGSPTEGDRPKEHIEVEANKAHLGNLLPENDPAADAPLEPLADPVRSPAPAPAMGRPPVLRYRPGAPARQAPPVDAYSLRLVAARALYDGGALVSRSPSLAALAQGPCLRANPADLGRMGVTTGDRVRVSSSRRSLVLDVAADPSVLRGSAVLAFNAPGEGAAELIDAAQPVTDLRVETVK
jgi:anaerobic selenocysteine-containing dehydrogenase